MSEAATDDIPPVLRFLKAFHYFGRPFPISLEDSHVCIDVYMQ